MKRSERMSFARTVKTIIRQKAPETQQYAVMHVGSADVPIIGLA